MASSFHIENFGCRAALLSALAGMFALSIASAQSPKGTSTCGAANVHLDHPTYLTTPAGVFAAELPVGWRFDHERNYTYFFLKSGEKYEMARTLMYIHIEKLEGPLQHAVESDNNSFRQSCPGSQIEDLPSPELLEAGCERTTQKFVCA